MKLGDYFTLEELLATQTGIPNELENDVQLVNLTRLVALILDPLRKEVGTLYILSGFRCEALNAHVGGSDNSYHKYGRAADVFAEHIDVDGLAQKCTELDLPYDKIIIERKKNGSTWLHIQIPEPGIEPRKQVLVAEEVNGQMQYRRMT